VVDDALEARVAGIVERVLSRGRAIPVLSPASAEPGRLSSSPRLAAMNAIKSLVARLRAALKARR
jgi:hypothetical protein